MLQGVEVLQGVGVMHRMEGCKAMGVAMGGGAARIEDVAMGWGVQRVLQWVGVMQWMEVLQWVRVLQG